METPSATVAVRGTRFKVDVDRDETVHVSVRSGIVVVENPMGSLTINAGHGAVVVKGNQPEPSVISLEESESDPDDWDDNDGEDELD